MKTKIWFDKIMKISFYVCEKEKLCYFEPIINIKTNKT